LNNESEEVGYFGLQCQATALSYEFLINQVDQNSGKELALNLPELSSRLWSGEQLGNNVFTASGVHFWQDRRNKLLKQTVIEFRFGQLIRVETHKASAVVTY